MRKVEAVGCWALAAPAGMVKLMPLVLDDFNKNSIPLIHMIICFGILSEKIGIQRGKVCFH